MIYLNDNKKLYGNLCNHSAHQCVCSDMKLFYSLIGEKSQWVQYEELIGSEYKHCICKHSIKRVFMIKNTETGERAIVGSSCINRIRDNYDQQKFDINESLAKQNIQFKTDTAHYSGLQLYHQNQILKEIKDTFLGVELLENMDTYMTYRPYIEAIMYDTDKSRAIDEININKRIYNNGFLKNLEIIRDNSTAASRKSSGKRDTGLKQPTRIQLEEMKNKLVLKPRLMDEFIHETQGNKIYQFSEILNWSPKYAERVTNANVFFKIYYKELNKKPCSVGKISGLYAFDD